jgi:hypothetical protein
MIQHVQNIVKIMKINIKPAYICMPLYCSISHSPPRLPSMCACHVTHGLCTLLCVYMLNVLVTHKSVLPTSLLHMYKLSFIGIHTPMHAPSKFCYLNAWSEPLKGYYVNVATTCYYNAAHTTPISSNSPYSNGTFIIGSSKVGMLWCMLGCMYVMLHGPDG